MLAKLVGEKIDESDNIPQKYTFIKEIYFFAEFNANCRNSLHITNVRKTAGFCFSSNPWINRNVTVAEMQAHPKGAQDIENDNIVHSFKEI